MDSLDTSIQFWKNLQYIGVPIIAAIFGGIFYLISQSQINKNQKIKDDLEKENNRPILSINAYEFSLINVNERIRFNYEILNLTDSPVLIESTTIAVQTSSDFNNEEKNNVLKIAPSSKANLIITKDRPYKALYQNRAIFPPEIIAEIDAKMLNLYLIGQCNYKTTRDNREWKYVFALKYIHTDGIVAIEIIQSDNLPK